MQARSDAPVEGCGHRHRCLAARPLRRRLTYRHCWGALSSSWPWQHWAQSEHAGSSSWPQCQGSHPPRSLLHWLIQWPPTPTSSARAVLRRRQPAGRWRWVALVPRARRADEARTAPLPSHRPVQSCPLPPRATGSLGSGYTRKRAVRLAPPHAAACCAAGSRAARAEPWRPPARYRRAMRADLDRPARWRSARSRGWRPKRWAETTHHHPPALGLSVARSASHPALGTRTRNDGRGARRGAGLPSAARDA